MNDLIRLMGVLCRVRLGVPAAERRRPQRVLIDLDLELDLAPAAASDDFRLTVDYWAVEKLVRRAASAREFQLAETLAERVAAAVLVCDRRIRAVRVAVHKKPAVMPGTREVVVEIRRTRADG